jgi:excisionase family DNA binding protein
MKKKPLMLQALANDTIEKSCDAERDDKVRYAGAARLTGLPLGTLYSYVSQKKIPHIRLGKRLVVFSRRALESWMADRTCGPSAPDASSKGVAP